MDKGVWRICCLGTATSGDASCEERQGLCVWWLFCSSRDCCLFFVVAVLEAVVTGSGETFGAACAVGVDWRGRIAASFLASLRPGSGCGCPVELADDTTGIGNVFNGSPCRSSLAYRIPQALHAVLTPPGPLRHSGDDVRPQNSHDLSRRADGRYELFFEDCSQDIDSSFVRPDES